MNCLVREVPAFRAGSPQCLPPLHRLRGQSRTDPTKGASHLDVRELAQVCVHGQQRLVHQLLVVIQPEEVIVLKEVRAHKNMARGAGPCPVPRSLLPETWGSQPRSFSEPQVKWG